MTGNTLSEFIDDILTTGGPEKEFLFREMLNNSERKNEFSHRRQKK